MFAAMFAGNAGIPVLALETRNKPGAKIRVSGGGRCNVLPSRMTIDDYSTHGSAKAMRNVLMSWPLAEVQEFFQRDLGLPLKIEETGKMFPVSDSSRDVVDAIMAGLSRAKVTVRGDARVTKIEPGFRLTLDGGEVIEAERVLLSGGGFSMPRTGSDGGTWGMARRLGHTVLPTYPALVPLLTAEADWHALSGLSLPVTLSARNGGRVLGETTDDFLFTHTGFSGPSALDISRHFTAPGSTATLHAGFTNVDWESTLIKPERRSIANLVREHVPRRLADTLLSRAGIPLEQTTSDLTREARKRLVETLTACELTLTGSEGYKTAEVTAGGIPLDEFSLKTLESKVVPGLYVAGEMLDVKGRIGGFNFLWAWVTGRKVGLAISNAQS